jgi:methylmalonyl-CoA/ethylmalonyl-CoA epimerase
MNVLGIHHVAFAHPEGTDVHDVLTKVLNLPLVHTEHADGLIERMIDTGGGYLQTLEAVGEDGVIKRFTDRRGAGLHHVALEVDDLAATVRDLIDRGVEMIDAAPRPGGDGTMVAFVHPRATSGLLIEFVEEIEKRRD